ncbi:divalent-cation tolerance protein CutA [Actinokineospora bangkokensis]|uniref:Divalent-cation tolerance protein CutA n=1 Tax=Actinokineospora bangkokensis TaxID=1193682 RepID=A0A1Q9LH24_9PSEU|nr:divalent-cation tolerance protein CutA [Actinokineospora bangkokensis]OLR91323.1 divalent-cation tolerance protein CutA [Actinokineospora bangkokensis]
MAHALVITTTDSADVAGQLAEAAVRERLAACAQVLGPVTSTYRWQGRVETAQEFQVHFKTARPDELIAHLGAAHPYDEPELISVPITGGSPGYLAWLTAESGA